MVSLLDRPQTGYELRQRFDRTVGFFWKASHQQIYQQLHKMVDKQWVKAQTVEQAARPNRIVYQLTEQGRAALDQWIEQPTAPPSVKEELIVKLFALGDVDTDQLRPLVQQRLALHRSCLAEYQQVMQQFYRHVDKLSPKQRGRYLGLRMGILAEQASIAWCEEAMEMLCHAPEAESACGTDQANL